MQAITKMLCPVPESISRSRVEISVQGNEVLAVIKKSVDDQINDIKTKLASVDSFSGLRISPMDFNKDIDISLYMDFIAASSKLRAENYGITSSDRLKDQIFDGELFGFAEPIAAPKQSVLYKIIFSCCFTLICLFVLHFSITISSDLYGIVLKCWVKRLYWNSLPTLTVNTSLKSLRFRRVPTSCMRSLFRHLRATKVWIFL